jgi:uncharacterized protein (DUF169 family)
METLARLSLSRLPVAIAFLAEPPPGVPRVGRALPAGCSYWKHASEGHAFYTAAEDHHNCPVGAFTHGVALPPAKAQELESLVGTMVELRYLRDEEVAAIPHRRQPFQVAAYAPLDRATFMPDVVVFRGNVRQIMLLSEAARAAGAFESGPVMGRPACALLPYALETDSGVASVACIGNRVYTDLGDDELYLGVPGGVVPAMLEKLDAILTANRELEAFHRQRAVTMETPRIE